MREFMDNVPLELLEATAKINIQVPGRPNLVFAPDPRRGNRRIELVPFQLAERIMGTYNKNRVFFGIADDLLQAEQDAYVERIVQSVVERVLTERGFIQRPVQEILPPIPLAGEAPSVASRSDLPAASQGLAAELRPCKSGRRPLRVLKVLPTT